MGVEQGPKTKEKIELLKQLTTTDLYNFTMISIDSPTIGGVDGFIGMLKGNLNVAESVGQFSVNLPKDTVLSTLAETTIESYGWELFKERGQGIGDEDTVYIFTRTS